MKYGYSFPRRSDYTLLRNSRGHFLRSLEEARRAIEEGFAPGYTGEPYIQLVEVRDDRTGRVIAEWSPREGWLTPMAAAGFVSRRVQ